MHSKVIKSNKGVEEQMKEQTKEKLKNIYDKSIKLYKKYFLPELAVKYPYIYKAYRKYLHVPSFFFFIFVFLSVLTRKAESYFLPWTELNWGVVAHTELFWTTFGLSFLIASFTHIRPYVWLMCCLALFFVYIYLTSQFPFLGQLIASQPQGHDIDALLFIASFILGHRYIYKKVFFVYNKGKATYIYEEFKDL